MAHNCPECYSACYCGGDIDDIFFENTAYETGCTHCPINGRDEDDDDLLDFDHDPIEERE